ncbi:homoserine O-succinyltransferase [uncultured Algimonas sp.]|uniref:homoserine O-succinyltransferase MetX n=1 Tax=uncultured Algimonas sp. TaxID=1547920 RepID=UPI00261E8026|nr:homoserine O-succinyltransferase [uncultured Algimonas sp.]
MQARDIETTLGDWMLSRGCAMRGDVVRGRLYGPDGSALVIVLGGISATRHVADGPPKDRGWWSRLVRRGGAVDLNRVQVLGLDFAPNDGGLDCPETITTADQATRLKALLDAHDLGPARAVIGSSYGGMCALAFARDYPDAVERLCIIGAAHKPYPIGVAWRGIQRRVVRLALDAGRPEAGLKLARELAMTTYRTPEEFADRFALEETGTAPVSFDICDYLGSRGDALAAHMDAARFLALSESIDLHRVEPETIDTPTLLMTAISDQLAPLPDMRELRDRLAGDSELFTFTSLYGHDAFLKEYDAMEPRLAAFMKDIWT